MFIVTGGAGLIGSSLVWKLNNCGITDILIVDHLGNVTDKWKNLAPLRYSDYLERDEFYPMLENGSFNGKKIDSFEALNASVNGDVRNIRFQ